MKGLIFTYALTYGGAVVSLVDPFVGLLIYICFAIVKPEYMWFWSVPPGNYSRIVAIGLLIGWMLAGFGDWRFGRARVIVGALIAYFLWATFLAAGAPNAEVAWNAIEALAKIVLPFVVGITLVDSVHKLRQLAWVIVLSQGYVALEFNLSYLGGYNRLVEENFGGMDNNCNAIALVTAVGLAFFLGLHAERWWRKAIAMAAAAMMAHAILISNSRGGMLASVITGVVTFWLLPKRPGAYLLFAVAGVLVLRFAGPPVIDRIQSTFVSDGTLDVSSESRLELWAACWRTMREHPLGVGPDHFPLIAERYGFTAGKEGHTLWLQVGAELGFPGLLLILAFYGTCIWHLWPMTRESYPVADPWLRYLARMVIAALAGFAVSAQFVSLKNLETPFYVVLIGAGILKVVSGPGGLSPAARRHRYVVRGLAKSDTRSAPALRRPDRPDPQRVG